MKPFKLLFFFGLLMFLISCTDNKSVREDDGIYRTFVRDSVFQRAVEDYAKEKSAQLGREDFAICAYFKNFEDSIVRCVLSCGVNPEKWDTLPFNFICQVGKHDLLVTMAAEKCGKKPFFKLKESSRNFYTDRYSGSVDLSTGHPKNAVPNRYLTFWYGRLVDKTEAYGTEDKKIKFCINGKNLNL